MKINKQTKFKNNSAMRVTESLFLIVHFIIVIMFVILGIICANKELYYNVMSLTMFPKVGYALTAFTVLDSFIIGAKIPKIIVAKTLRNLFNVSILFIVLSILTIYFISTIPVKEFYEESNSGALRTRGTAGPFVLIQVLYVSYLVKHLFSRYILGDSNSSLRIFD